MNEIIFNGQIAGGSAELLNVETISEGLKKYVINYSEFFAELIKVKTNITLTFKNLNYTIIIKKDELSREYVVMAWDYELRDIFEKKLGFKTMSGYNVNLAIAALAEAVLACGQDTKDYIDCGYFMGNAMALLESNIDDNVDTISDLIDETKDIIDDIVDVDWWELDENGIKQQITENCDLIADQLRGIAQARENFIKDLSDYYECDFGFGDAYSDEPVVDIYPYYSEISDFDCTQAFEDILNYLFDTPSEKYNENRDTCETLLSLRDTMFHYLMVA